MEISPAQQIKDLMCPGRTYFFKADEHKGDNAHYFVILNTKPWEQGLIVFAVMTTITTKQFTAKFDDMFKKGTIVQVANKEDAEFVQHPSFFNCNCPYTISKEMVIQKLAEGKLRQRGVVSEVLLCSLRSALLKSSLVEPVYKNMIH